MQTENHTGLCKCPCRGLPDAFEAFIANQLPPDMTLREWTAQGEYHQVLGHQVFVLDRGRGSQTIALLHGYPSCSLDFWDVLPLLTKQYRVIVHDHLGFGLSDKPRDYSYSLIEQADIALALWRQLGVEACHLVAHDYGTSIATEIIARQQRHPSGPRIHSLTLSNGSMLIELSQLRPIQKLLKHKTWGPIVAQLSNEQIFLRNMRKIWGHPSRFDPEELRLHWQLLIHKDGRRVLPQLTQYINERYRFWHRWVGSLYQSELPVNVLWATKDPVAVVAMAHELHRHIANSQIRLLEGIGHYPMMEAPSDWAEGVLEFIAHLNI
ncbi:MAG: alpha/beta hydrolase [Bacteroidota bacterium]